MRSETLIYFKFLFRRFFLKNLEFKRRIKEKITQKIKKYLKILAPPIKNIRDYNIKINKEEVNYKEFILKIKIFLDLLL